MRQIFMVSVDVPDGVSASEMESHLADAHRMAVRNYHPSDPLSRVGEIEVTVESMSREPVRVPAGCAAA